MKIKKLFWSLLIPCFLIACKKEVEETPINPDFVAPWPEWVFSHWIWEDEGTSTSAKQLADDYLAHDIPVGAIVIDSPWETGYNTFEWDSSLYPDAKEMVDYFHSKNIKTLVWITGAVNTDLPELYQECKDKNYFMTKNSAGEEVIIDWWKGPGGLIDFWNPEARAWLKSRMDKVLDIGIDGWKTDGTDYYQLLAPYSRGKGRVVPRLDYSYEYYRLFFEYTRERLGKDRVIMSRPFDNYGINVSGDIAAFSPVDITFAGWVGDQDPDFKGLKAALNNLYESSKLGYLIIGSDIGGYREDNTLPGGRDKETFIRWAQLGAFCPLMENGGGGEHRPWKFDDETLKIYKTFVSLHNQMGSYLHNTAKVYFQEKKSLMQFLKKADYSYTLGPDIFVTPIKEAGTGSLSITFPKGTDQWVYLFDKSKIYNGGSSVSLSFPIDEFPVFVKKGSAMADSLTP